MKLRKKWKKDLPMKMNFNILIKLRRKISHLEGYNKPALRIDYDHLAKVLEAKEKFKQTNQTD